MSLHSQDRGPDEQGPVSPGPDEHGPVSPGPDEHGPVSQGPDEHGPVSQGPDEPGPDEHSPDEHGQDLGDIAQASIELAERWLVSATESATRTETKTAARLQALVGDQRDAAFAMRFVDRVIRPEDRRTAAQQLRRLVDDGGSPGFLSPVDRALLRAGSWLAPYLPWPVMPLAQARLRALVGHLVVDAEPETMARHFGQRRRAGFDLNVNLLGEAVLGAREADRRHAEALALLDQPDVDYVSVKVSAIAPRLNLWDHEGSLDRVVERLRPLFQKASQTAPPTFVNLDMEEYHDLELTLEAFMRLLVEPDLHHVDAGIVLQAYLPDALPALRRLEAWASERRATEVDGRAGGQVKVRLVKGANLAMEEVDAAIHGWEQAPYPTKAETDANYKRCLDWLLRPDRLRALRVGVASHNLFDCAFAHLLADERGVSEAVTIEMLEGMAPAQARAVQAENDGLLLYTPVVAEADFDVAISYLFRRLDENTSPENFIRHLFDLEPGSDRFTSEADKFRRAVEQRWTVAEGPRRHQDRVSARDSKPAVKPAADRADRAEPDVFRNEPDTDPTLPASRAWMLEALAYPVAEPTTPITTDTVAIDHLVDRANRAQPAWARSGGPARRQVLLAVADEMARRRGDLIAAMVAEGHKTVAQADPEISEAIDFARYYADRAAEFDRDDGDNPASARFEPFGVVLVVPPWNFPVAIPAGGVLAALAAGNAAVLKPAPETPRCAEIVAECCWAAGVADDVLAFVRTPDDDTGRHLVAHQGIDAVILTGGYETAKLFRSWRPERPLLAETSGKNALVITPSADIDLAVSDLVDSAFGHSGQKCSAASLAITVGSVVDSPRFRRQLVDAVTSLKVGPAGDLASDLAPVIAEPTGKLARALTDLEAGETWLVEPRRLDDGLWSPGVRLGVQPGSWFHQTECFGPVLGVMVADDLDHAIELQNGTSYGLTGGLHSLDPTEIKHWLERVEIGNAYVNRVTTGAIVQRQPFGGWKRSSVGPGAKAGGPNYVAQLGRWTDRTGRDGADGDGPGWLATAKASDAQAWDEEFSRDHDPTGLFCEENTFRYRPLPVIVVRLEADVGDWVEPRIKSAAGRCGVPVIWSRAGDESQAQLAERLDRLETERIRLVGEAGPELRAAAADHGVHIADNAVTADGRRELLHYLREQAISRTVHRYGNII